MTMPKVSNDSSNQSICILIDNIIHILIIRSRFLGFQSWIEKSPAAIIPEYKIEIYLEDHSPILCEYEVRSLWESVIKELARPI